MIKLNKSYYAPPNKSLVIFPVLPISMLLGTKSKVFPRTPNFSMLEQLYVCKFLFSSQTPYKPIYIYGFVNKFWLQKVNYKQVQDKTYLLMSKTILHDVS